MGINDMKCQALNVLRMRLTGAKICPVSVATGILKDPNFQTIRD